MDNQLANTKKGIFFSVVSKAVALLLPFVSRTALIRFLGMEYVGLNSLFSSILQVLNFSELGIGSTVVYFLYKPVAEGNTSEIRSILGFCKKCYLIIGTVIMVIGLGLTPFTRFLVSGTTPADVNFYALYIISLVNTFIGYYLFAYKQTLLIATQRTDTISKINIICDIFLNVSQVIAVAAFKSFYAFCILKIISTSLSSVLIEISSKKLYPEYYPSGSIPQTERKDVKKKIEGMLCQRIGQIVFSSADNIIISTFLGLTILGKYNSYFYITNALVQGIGALDTAVLPMIGNYSVERTKNESQNLFNRLNSLYAFIVIVISACYLFLARDFMLIWVGEDNLLSSSIVVLLTLYFYFYRIKDPVSLYIDAVGLWWTVKFIPLIEALFNLVTNIILVHIIGVSGVVLSTVIAVAFIDIPFNTYMLYKYYFKKQGGTRRYFLSQLIYLAAFIVGLIPIYFVSRLFTVNSIAAFILKGIMVLAVSTAIYFALFSLDKTFRQSMRKLLISNNKTNIY